MSRHSPPHPHPLVLTCRDSWLSTICGANAAFTVLDPSRHASGPAPTVPAPATTTQQHLLHTLQATLVQTRTPRPDHEGRLVPSRRYVVLLLPRALPCEAAAMTSGPSYMQVQPRQEQHKPQHCTHACHSWGKGSAQHFHAAAAA